MGFACRVNHFAYMCLQFDADLKVARYVARVFNPSTQEAEAGASL